MGEPMNDLVDQIEEIRRQTNTFWMDILRVALESNPERTKAILLKIKRNDSEIQRLLAELASD